MLPWPPRSTGTFLTLPPTPTNRSQTLMGVPETVVTGHRKFLPPRKYQIKQHLFPLWWDFSGERLSAWALWKSLSEREMSCVCLCVCVCLPVFCSQRKGGFQLASFYRKHYVVLRYSFWPLRESMLMLHTRYMIFGVLMYPTSGGEERGVEERVDRGRERQMGRRKENFLDLSQSSYYHRSAGDRIWAFTEVTATYSTYGKHMIELVNELTNENFKGLNNKSAIHFFKPMICGMKYSKTTLTCRQCLLALFQGLLDLSI